MLKLSMWMGALILAGLVQGAPDAQDVLGPQGGIQKLGVRRMGVRRPCGFQLALDAQVRGQLAQVAQVDGSFDFRGFDSSCPRCPRCFNGGSI